MVQRDSFFRASNTFWKRCMDDIMGAELAGTACQNDSSCVALGAIGCSMNTHTCMFDRDVLARRFLQVSNHTLIRGERGYALSY